MKTRYFTIAVEDSEESAEQSIALITKTIDKLDSYGFKTVYLTEKCPVPDSKDEF